MTLRPHRSLVVASAALIGLLAVCAPATATPGHPATTRDPASASAGWLAQQFAGPHHAPSLSGDHFEGSYGSPVTYYFDGGTTADAIYALAAAKAGRAKIDDAIAYFERHVAEYTSIGDTSGAPGPSDGQIGKTALAAIVAGADPTSFGGFDLLATLAHDECTAPSGSRTDFTVPTCPAAGAGRNILASVSESLIVTAEARAGSGHAPSAAAVAYLLSLQCNDGGFTVTTSGGATCASDVDATGYAVAALVALGDQQAALTRATTWLLGQRHAAGYWVAQGGPDVDSTGLATSALDAVGKDTSVSRAWLASQQVTTGPTVGAGASRGALKYQGRFNASSSIKATADGLLGMVHGASLATLTATGASPGTSVLALAAPRVGSVTVRQGGTQTITGLGFAAGETVSGVLHSASVDLPGVTAGATGTAVVNFAAPATLAVGTHNVVLTGASSGLTSTATFAVLAALPGPGAPAGPAGPAASGGPSLAATGLDGRQLLAEISLGVLCVGAGAGIVYGARRRRA